MRYIRPKSHTGKGRDMNEQLKAGVYGAAIGDALGVPYEFMTRDTFTCTDMVGHGTHDQEPGTWSDDTSMMIACADSIRANQGAIDVKDIRQRFNLWRNDACYTPDGVVFDCGITVSNALRRGRGMDGERDNGNGSLMRILPLAFADAADSQIGKVSAITHAHEQSKLACIMYVHIARDLARGMSAAEAVDANAVFGEPFDRIPRIAELGRADIKSSGYVLHTLEASLWCLLNTSTYEDCVLEAVNLGSDTDTTACVAGGLAGILYGLDGIPSAWIDTLRRKDLIDSCLW